MKKKSSGMVVVQGYVDPCRWNRDEDVEAVQVVTDDMREYQVEHTGQGGLLLEYVDEYVEVEGTLSKKQGRQMIRVRSFEVLDAPEVVDDYDEEEDWRD